MHNCPEAYPNCWIAYVATVVIICIFVLLCYYEFKNPDDRGGFQIIYAPRCQELKMGYDFVLSYQPYFMGLWLVTGIKIRRGSWLGSLICRIIHRHHIHSYPGAIWLGKYRNHSFYYSACNKCTHNRWRIKDHIRAAILGYKLYQEEVKQGADPVQHEGNK